MAPADLGIRIKRARERLNMSQQQLADAVNRSVRAVGSWERGEAVPKNAIGALEDVLGEDLTTNGVPLVQPDMGDPAEALIWSRATRYSVEERREFLLDLRARKRAAANTG